MKKMSIASSCVMGLTGLLLIGCAERSGDNSEMQPNAPVAGAKDSTTADTEVLSEQSTTADSAEGSAEAALASALAEAAESNRRVLVHLGAPW